MVDRDWLFNWEDYGLVQNIQFDDGNYGLDFFEKVFNSENGFPKMGIQYTLNKDQIQSGGLFSKKYEDCLVLRTTEIEGCAPFVFTAQSMGNITKLSIYRWGTGASQEQIDKKNRRMQGGALSMIAGMMTKVDEMAMERENFYYNAVIRIIKELFF